MHAMVISNEAQNETTSVRQSFTAVNVGIESSNFLLANPKHRLTKVVLTC